MPRPRKIVKPDVDNDNIDIQTFSDVATSYYGRIEDFNNLMQFHPLSEIFQQQMFEVIDEFLNNDERVLRIACLGCKGGGKSSNMILIILMILLTTKEQCMLFYLSAKEQQSKSIFTNEVKHLINSAKSYKGELEEILEIQDKVVKNKVTTNEIRILTFSASSHGLTLAGIHCDGLHVIVIDEAPAIPDTTFEQLKGVVASGKSIFLCAGNPDVENLNFFWRVMSEEFGEENATEENPVGEDAIGWKRYNINYLDLKRVDDKQKEAMKMSYREGTPEYIKYVLGKYPPKDEFTLIDHKQITSLLYITPEDYNMYDGIYHIDRYQDFEFPFIEGEDIYIGVDVANGKGQAYTTIFARTESMCELIYYSNKVNILDTLNFLHTIFKKYNRHGLRGNSFTDVHFIIDADGVGNSLCVLLESRNQDYSIIPFHNNVANDVHHLYHDRRSEHYGKLASWLREGNAVNDLVQTFSGYYFGDTPEGFKNFKIIIPHRYVNLVKPKLIKEAKQSRYDCTDQGKRKLYSKSEQDSRFNTDLLDAMALTFWYEHYENLV